MSRVERIPTGESGYFKAKKNERQRLRVLEYLTANAVNDFLEDPFGRLAQMLLDRFGFSITEGKGRAEKICRELYKEKRIEFRYTDKVITGVLLLPERTASKPQPPLPVKPKKAHHFVHKGKKTVPPAVRLKRSRIYGIRNQSRFFRLMTQLAAYITTIYDDGRRVILKATQSRQRDSADRDGEDVNLHAVVAFRGSVSKFGRFIYDVKSSEMFAAQFNSKIWIKKGQIDAKVKRAIVVNPKKSDISIISEVLNDMEEQNLLTSTVRMNIERYFSGTQIE